MFTLIEAVKTAKAHTDATGFFPILECIHVTDDGFVEASDRYTAVRVRLLDTEQAAPGLYSPVAIKQILAGAIPQPDMEGDFPALSRLYPDAMDPRDEVRDWSAGPMRFEAKTLNRFGPSRLPKAPRGHSHNLVFTPGINRNKPLMVTLADVDADHWRALIMPVRPPAI